MAVNPLDESTTNQGGISSEPPYRMQSAMVLFALEEALGSFVVQAAPQRDSLPAAMLSVIEERIQGTGFVPVAQIVQETYLKEIINLAVSTSQDRAEGDALKRLRALVEALDAFDIRNAVCHPNRQFPEYYWYRMAALATDPCIEKLRLLRVTDAFRCAVEKRLTPPPEGWLEQRSSSVPNNLPLLFDHQVTGLIARHEEAKDFRKRLQNMRNSLVAIVGPGGTGKTALCLEVLRDCLLDPSTLDWAQQLVYVSAKTEQLTARGVEPIPDPLTSLASVKNAIVGALYSFEDADENGNDVTEFETVAKELANRRVLLCIDNLETLIRDHPQDFEDFVQSLPREWRVVVTSRVSVNGANVLSLGPIKREGAMKLTRDYILQRGATRLDEVQIGRLVDVCNRTPLAIRLAIDSFAAGSELSKALEQTKDRITDFAYTSLVEHLPEDASKVMECLFGSNTSLSRGQIGHLLDLSPDGVAEAVNSLLRTSLVTREIDGAGERYTLSSSVRELLLRTPTDSRVRDDVYSRIREQQRIIADLDRSGTKDPLNESFVPLECPVHIRALVARIRPSAIGQSSRAQQIYALEEVRRAREFEADLPVLHRTEALLLERIGDRFGAIECFGKAVHCVAQDPFSQLRLAELLREENRLEEAKEQTAPLIEAGYLLRTESSPRNRARLFRAHWVSVLWLKQFDAVLEATKDWNKKTDLRPSYIALRVSALQRYLDEGTWAPSEQDGIVADMLTCLQEAFRLDGYVPEVVHEGFRALDRLLRLLSRGVLTHDSTLKIARFLDAHLPSMCETYYERSLGDEFVVNLVAKFRSVGRAEENPLQANRWYDLISLREHEDPALNSVGYVPARITNIFPSKGYLFARALDGTRDFYVPDSATGFSSREFSELRQGQVLQILPSRDSQGREGSAWPAGHAMK